MKKLLILSTILFTSIIPSKASHVLGGEIGWTCLANGKYIFYMITYRDCTGIPFNYTDENVTIVGDPLPRNAAGNPFSTIALAPDSNRWVAEDNGDTSPSCTDQYGSPYTCDNRDPGSVQQFFYKSDPITLAGNPNRAGWKFYWESVCCRPGAVENVQTTGTMLLRAEMYRTKDLDDKDPCIDSSPSFKSLPTNSICRGYEFTYNPTAIDSDLDSLIYSWDRPYNPPYETPVALPYNTGFSPDNPTPDETFDAKNIASTLDSLSGEIKMAVYSGTGTKKYITVIQVDSYRDGVKIATVYREIPVSIFNCPNLPNGKKNNPPEVFIDSVPAEGVVIDVTAGQKIRIPIQVKDLDVTGVGNQLQNVTMMPDGLLFSRDRASATPCQVTYGAGQNLVVEPCAYMRNKTPFLDNQSTPPERKITGLSGFSSEFIWQTSCSHIQTKTGVPGTNEGVYNFVLRVSDDHCPVPAINYATITVRVKDPEPLTAPIMKGISVGLDGKITYQWVPPIDSAFSFEKYIVEEQKTVDGIPVSFNTWNSFIPEDQRDYKQEYKSQLYAIFRYKNNLPANGFDILKKISNRDWYMRMTGVSGCTDDIESNPSDPVRIMELEAEVSPNTTRKHIDLSWNSPKTDSARTYDYFKYESKTRYYIWQSDSTFTPSLNEYTSWYLRDSTYSTAIELSSNSCNEYTAFRIEARDTVITYKRGNGLDAPVDSLDTLTFSTFSVVDTILLNYAKPKVQRKAAEVLISDYPADYYEWIDCNADTALANGAQREFILKDTGRYAVITQNGGCIDTSNCFKVSVDLNDSIVKNGKASLESLETLANYQWYNCNSNSIIPGATNRKYIASDTGNYGVIVSVFNHAVASNCLPVELNLNDSIVLIGKDSLKSLDNDANYQWYNCGKNSIIQGATEQTLVMTDTGYYAVIVSEFGYSDTSNCYPYFPIGLPKQSFQEGIVVYPNPTNEKLSIRLNKNYKNVQLRVISIHGQVVQEKQINQQQLIELNLTGDAGIYFIQLTNQKGERANFKVVKQ